MSLHPIKSRKARHRAQAHLKGRNREEWKPFQAWDWNSARKKGLELLGKKTFVLFLVSLAITIGVGAMYVDPNNALFHRLQPPPCHIFPSWSSPECADPIQTIWNATTSDSFNLYAGNKTITTATNCFDFAGNTPSCL